MSDLIHLDDGERRDRYRVFCGAADRPLSAVERAADHKVVVLDNGVHITLDAATATCPKCVEAYETRAQVVTTTDLLTAIRLLRRIANRHGCVGGGPDPDIVALNALEKRLERPRKITRDRAVAGGTCGKCGSFVAAGDDCATCYPR